MGKFLVESWKTSWTKWSQKINAVITLLPLAWASLPEKWQDVFPHEWIMVFALLGMTNFVLSNIKQKNRQ